MIKFTKGIKYGNLTPLQDTGKKTPQNAKIWLFRCDCGNETEKEARIVKAGRTQSCGKCEISRGLKGRRHPLDLLKRKGIRSAHNKFSLTAQKEKQAYEISGEHLDLIMKSNCSLCGNPPSLVIRGIRGKVNRPARMRKSAGYVSDNVQAVCTHCWDFLNGTAIEQMLEFMFRIQRHSRGK